MAKKTPKKRMNRKMKRAIRKSISAMFMATALLVAAIPVDSVSATGGTTPSSAPDTLEEVEYPASPVDVPNLGIQVDAGTEQFGYEIVSLDNGASYRMDKIYKIATATNGENAISGYNSDYTPPNRKLTIPANVVANYDQFDETTVGVQAYMLDKNQLQYAYNIYHPDNVYSKDANGDGVIDPVTESNFYHTDFSEIDNVTQYALDVYACDLATNNRTIVSGNGTAGYKAQIVIVGKNADNTNVTKYVPFNPTTQEFWARTDKSYNILYIANGAFSSNTFDNSGAATGGNAINVDTLILSDSIVGIGNSAFENVSALRSIELGDGIKNIGNRAFKGCGSLSSVKISNVEKIGTEAFANCTTLPSIELPTSLSEIGTGAFVGCNALSGVNMGGVTAPNQIDDFAFYNCPSLSNVVFSTMTQSIGEGAFAVPSTVNIGGNWTSIEFPANVNYFGDSVLEGRTNLKECTLPASYGGTGPETLGAAFFRRCSNLSWVKIGGPFLKFPNNAFVSVKSDDFYIEGPATRDGSTDYRNSDVYARPRESARTHEPGLTYKFTVNGVSYYEVAYTYEDDFGTEVTDYYLINTKTQALEEYTPGNTTGAVKIVIKGNYNGVSVKSIAKGCFDGVKDRAVSLEVQDNTISGIDKEAFKDFKNLESVYLGNSVTSVGASAFEGCDKLTDVYFAMDKVTIGDKAFSKNVTASPIGLTFHGKIESGFAPFDWAMKAENELSDAGLRVLYKGLSPADQGTIYDRAASEEGTTVTPLIFYPIYEHLDADNEEYRKEKAEKYGMSSVDDYSITGRYEKGTAGEVPNGTDPAKVFADAEDVEYVNAAYNVVIPSGITSIDSPAFYNAQANNTSIATYVGGRITNPSNSREAVMYASMSTAEGAVPGLFSGYYEDYTNVDEAAQWEKNPNGNDRVESITMTSVTSIPDYAFDSCERLQKVDLGAACKEIGVAPFRGCTALEEVIGNDTIVCENDIIYTANGDGTYTLVECLPSRGTSGNFEVSVSNDPKLAQVSEIKESAFIDCDKVISVNMKGNTVLTRIPKECFKGCTSLKNVVLPSSVNYIEEDAFVDLESIHVTIPAREVYIHQNAFKHGNSKQDPLATVVIKSYENSSAQRYTQDNYIGFEVYNEYEHTVRFLNYDYEELYKTTVQDGQSVRPFLDAQTEPKRSGYKFAGWKCITSGISLDQITDDAIFVATFSGGSSGSGSVSGNGSGSNGNTGNNNGSSNNNNGNNNSSDSDSSELYTLTVINGSGSGSYVEDADVIIAANNPATGKKFKEWVVDTNNATLASNRVAATSFKMPGADVKVTAVYEDDKSSSSNKNNSSVSGNSSGSSSNRNNSTNGTKVIITRPGISDTDLAAAKVNGSKDSYIVKISETAEATAAVEAALINKYGSLDNIRYCAMDISLYDSTGTNKITDTTGYTIDITIPLPDSLREYAGNNKTAAVVNSQLEALSPKFTTIDGVPCVTFRATHFSPYTVYVDTQNLTAGGLDSTPKTGDGIHPKWFLSMGLACLSVILFMKKDKKSPKVKVA